MPAFVVRGLQIVVVGVLAGLAVAAGIGLRGATESEPSTVPVVEIGPPPGVRVDEHAAAAAVALRDAAGRRVGVVSFREYRHLDDVDDLVEAIGGLEVEGHLVAIPGTMPAFVDDVEFWVADQVFEAEEQRTQLEELAPTVDDPEFRRFYEAEIDRYSTVVTRASSAPVFGAVVVGDAEDLRALAADPAVRLVDVGLGERLADTAVVRGLRPEERTLVGQPETRR